MRRHTSPKITALTLLALMVAAAIGFVPVAAAPRKSLDRIKHVIVIYYENWSFDGLFGSFPGANGIANAGATVNQVTKDGVPYTTLPQPFLNGQPDPRFPPNLPVRPFDLAPFVPPDQQTNSPVHLFYQEQYQINGGLMNKFVAWNDAGGDHGGLALSYYDATEMPLGQLAQQYTLCDNFFHSAFGGSWLNHMWLVSARTPYWPDAPQSMIAQLDADGVLVPGTRPDAEVTPDRFAVNTVYPSNEPHPPLKEGQQYLPTQTYPNIGDRLSRRGISWAWYAGGWNDAVAGNPDPTFQFHHQPFVYFAGYGPGTRRRAAHLKDETEFFDDLQSGKLPAVSFIKPLGIDNMHPGYSSVIRGQQHGAALVEAVRNSPYWEKSVIIITFDEHGGRWDHVAPPVVDRWGPGSRVPAIIISPFAKKGFVDHTQYETASILKFIEKRWRLAPLTRRDAAAADLTNAFDF